MTVLVSLALEASVDAWRSFAEPCGLNLIDHDNGVRVVIGGVAIDITEGTTGITGWRLHGDGTAVVIDQIATEWVGPYEGARNDAVSFDHVVLMTDDLLRTCDAITATTDAPLKRIREAGGGRQQGFFRFGEAIIEVVGPVGEGPSLWGFVLNVDDLHEVCDRLGPDLASLPKPAVQPGRFISTVRQSAGLGTAIALMSR